MRELGAIAEQINFVFVTVDPERDRPAYLAEYLSSFDCRIIGLTGAPDQVAALAGALGAVYARIASADGDYTIDHSVNAFLIARDWQSVSSIYMGTAHRAAGRHRRVAPEDVRPSRQDDTLQFGFARRSVSKGKKAVPFRAPLPGTNC
jgi:cytochrome oxidase Cu insertion factor (SCO1/SenC/PrrC family)